MEILLDGKRIFEVENPNYDYVVFPAEKIQTYIQLNGYLIKKGDLQYPKKWINMEDASDMDCLVLESSFNPDEYECLFFDDLGLKEAIQKILSPYNIQIDNDIKKLLSINELPLKAALELKELFTSEKYANDYSNPLDFARYEGYEFECNGKIEKWFIGEEELPCTSITYDTTRRFVNMCIVETYYKETKNHTEHVFKTHTGEWYRYYAGDIKNNFWIMEDIEGEELVSFPFHLYKLQETTPRQLPEKEKEIKIDWSKFIEKERLYDFYYSEKEFTLRILHNKPWNDLVNIDGEWKRFTKKVSRGEEPFESWDINCDDEIFLGSATFGDIKEEEFTEQQLDQLCAEIRERSYAKASK
ncbi:hypothetical protein [Bacillus cereus]|uniref:Uncharacterized protein n=1 Tax=Bacillus cereus VD184 TaxID=1053242 RepID=A0A9W5VS43_BACCE|nr:hypothetical protein [Bacillus cereus]EOQ09115.1 hypothetical protein IKC_06079 [Bacillus cereus VD184]